MAEHRNLLFLLGKMDSSSAGDIINDLSMHLLPCINLQYNCRFLVNTHWFVFKIKCNRLVRISKPIYAVYIPYFAYFAYSIGCL
jgi:hypothetical protein